MPKVKLTKLTGRDARIVRAYTKLKTSDRFNAFMQRFGDPEVQAQLANFRDHTITDIKSIRIRPAYQPDELAICITPKDGHPVHLLIKGHYA